jgi:hypothetical protein
MAEGGKLLSDRLLNQGKICAIRRQEANVGRIDPLGFDKVGNK